jgi:hypothetical protein
MHYSQEDAELFENLIMIFKQDTESLLDAIGNGADKSLTRLVKAMKFFNLDFSYTQEYKTALKNLESCKGLSFENLQENYEKYTAAYNSLISFRDVGLSKMGILLKIYRNE